MKNGGARKYFVTFLAGIIFNFSGCIERDLFVKENNKTNYGRSFFGGSIIYFLEPGARKYIDQIITLRKFQLSPLKGNLLKRLSDEQLLAIHKEADEGNKDRYITKEEAEKYYNIYSKMLEEKIEEVVPKESRDAYKEKYEKNYHWKFK